MRVDIQAILFDCGGVICRAEDESGLHKWEARLGIPHNSLGETVYESEIAYQALLGQVTEDDVWRQMAADFKLNEAELAELRVDFWSGHIVDTELLQFIQKLRHHYKYKTAILSNFWTGAREKFDQLFELQKDIVDEIIISSEEGLVKPDTQIYQLTADRLGVPVESVLFIDDMAENIEGAEKAGMSGIQFINSSQTIREIKQYIKQC